MQSASGSSVRFLLLLALLPVLSACETLSYYRQVVWGQWQLLNARIPVEQITSQQDASLEVRARLALAQQILTYGNDELLLEPDGRYTSYVHLEREYVVWNLFAAAPFEVEGKHWCYPVVGCAPYRGYFSEAAADKAAQKYAARGMETYVGGVPAYSTLGWFDDPLLSTFIFWPEPDLANLLLHEMAHSKIWVSGDAAFNESFAEFVGNTGAQLWLESQGKSQAWLTWRQRRSGWRHFRDFTVVAKTHLQNIYTTAAPNAERLQQKTAAMVGIQACYQAHRSMLGAGRYDQLMAERFNNAFLVSIGTYADWLPAFAVLFERAERQWREFYAEVGKLAALDAGERDAALAALAEHQVTQRADDDNANEINCEAFLSHGAHGETAG